MARTLAGLALAGALAQTLPARPVLIIAHRGASGHRPEHTLESYSLAISMGADFIEPDVVATKDGVLVARHENEIGGTTDVARKFAARKTTKTIDGQVISGWFTEDFTLAELQTLRATERLPFRSHAFDGQFAVPTFEDVLELAEAASRETGRRIGVYPETKHPTYFRGIDLALEKRLVDVLARRGLTRHDDPVIIQSFEPSSLEALSPLTALRLVLLLDEGADASPARLAAVSKYADGIGPHKRLVLPANGDGTLRSPTSLVEDAHRAGLFVHVWTMRSDPAFLSSSYVGDPRQEYTQFAGLGVDGLFTDFPDVAYQALRPSGQAR